MREALRLELKETATRLAPVTEGIPFLGFRVYPGVLRLNSRTLRQFRRQWRGREQACRAGRLGDGETVALPDAPYVHLFVARGSVSLGGDTLVEGDAARLTAAGAVDVTGVGDAEVIVWESDRDSGR